MFYYKETDTASNLKWYPMYVKDVSKPEKELEGSFISV